MPARVHLKQWDTHGSSSCIDNDPQNIGEKNLKNYYKYGYIIK